MLSKAVEWGYLDANPAQSVKVSGSTVKRDRFLQPDELARFFEAVVAEPNETIRDLILLALLTGARRSNVCAMHWREIDLKAGVWKIKRTKNGEPQTVTLCPEAIAILEMRKEAAAILKSKRSRPRCRKAEGIHRRRLCFPRFRQDRPLLPNPARALNEVLERQEFRMGATLKTDGAAICGGRWEVGRREPARAWRLSARA